MFKRDEFSRFLPPVGNNTPVPTILTPAEGTTYNVGDTINFSGSATDAEDGQLSGNSLSWELLLQHNDHAHPDGLPATSGENGSFVVPDHGDNTAFELCLTATDNDGLSDTDCVLINPNSVSYTFDSVPSGLALVYGEDSHITPFTVEAIVGGERLIAAPSQQANFAFSNWSDGGDAAHNITIGSTSQTFIASYTMQNTFSDSFSTFADLSQIHLNGNADGESNVLRLTPANVFQAGSAFYHVPFGMTEESSFSTRFQFKIHGAGNGADGIVFMIQGNELTALGPDGGALGYTGIANSLAIEIDSYQGGDDPSANHIGVRTGGQAAHEATYTPPFDLENGASHTLWLDYDGTADSLNIYLAQGASSSKPSTSIISLTGINLHALVGDQAYLGFSAATGGLRNNHDIENWDFSISESPPTGGNGDSFSDFSDLSLIQLNGNALGTSNVLRLTPAETQQIGSAFYNQPFAITTNSSFSTRFDFNIHLGGNGADGMVFMMQGNDSTALGAGGAP